MAFTEKLSELTLTSIANQIGKQIFYVVDQKLFGDSSMKLTETFSVWNLEAHEIREAVKARKDLKQVAAATGLWHHQIRIDAKEIVFARSQPLGESPESWSIREISLSPLAGKIDDAIGWVDDDKHVPEETLVRLLFVPEYYLHAFWLIKKDADESQVLVIDAPRLLEYFEPEKLYSSGKFLERLPDKPPFTGIRLK